MKIIYIKLLTVAIILFSILNSELAAQWDTLNTGLSSDLHAVMFINSNTGWIAGANGVIKKSTNGGNNWSSQSINSSQSLRRIIMIDANTGFICGDSGKILKTTNGGNNWSNTNTSSNTANIYAMDFINASTGICANVSRTQFKTTNGGTTWTGSTMSGVNSLLSIYGIDMTDHNIVYACTGPGSLTSAKVYKSTNSGTNYTASLNDATNFFSTTINDVKFINSSTGYACASNNNLARTTNGGTTWTVNSFPKGINQISFPDSQNGYICGEATFKAKSDNSGASWTIDYNYNTSETLFGISFINSSTGWMCGTNGMLLKTTNGSGFPPSCNIINSSWANINENVSDGYESVIDDCGNIYITGYTGSGESNENILTQKFSSSGYLYWSKTYNGSGNLQDRGTEIKLDDDGNVFVAGFATGSATGMDFVLIKYFPDGQRDWVRTYDTLNLNEQTVALTIDNSGNSIIVGHNVYPDLDRKMRVLKYNTNGDLQWKRWESYGQNTAVDIACNNSDAVFIAFQHFNEFNENYGFITKYDSSGTLQWSSGNYEIFFKSLVIGNNGNIYISGNNRGIFFPIDLVTIKYNTSGVQQWIRYLDGGLSMSDNPTSMNISNGGELVITGKTRPFSGLSEGSYILTVKYNSDGDLQWYQRYENPLYYEHSAIDMTRDASGNIYITGYCSDSLTPHEDIITLKYNSAGTFQNVKFYGNSELYEQGRSVNIDNTGNVFVTGWSYNTAYNSIVIKYAPSDFSNDYTLNLTALIQGFYNSASDLMTQDTARIYLRTSSPPYAISDSAISILSNTGAGQFSFSSAVNGTGYYLQLQHRNSIETWSKTAQQFTSNSLNYNFTTANTQAYGDNLLQVDASPIKFAVYSGDVNQDGVVDGTDGVMIDNDAANFNTGYLATDLNGDEIIDGSDAAIADNNAANFVSKIIP